MTEKVDVKSLLFITQFLPAPKSPRQTGGIISNLNMLRSLAQRYNVSVLSFDGESIEKDFSEETFSVISRSTPPWRALHLMRFWLEFVRTEVERVIGEGPPPDAVIATSSTLAAFDVCPSNVNRVALVQAYENFGLLCPWVPWRQRMNLGKLAAVRRFQDRRLMRCADAVLTNSKFMQRAASERFGINSEHIHVFLQAHGVQPSQAAAPEGTIGFVNRGPEKGLSFVLELARRSPDLRYLVYGHERGRPDALPSNVDWRGWASDRAAMFSSAKLWLVPSLWSEPFGRVSIEAQAADRAVLVAGTGGLPETVLELQFLMEGFDMETWQIRIRSLLEFSPDKLRQNGAQIRELFSSKAHDARILNTFDHILSESGDHNHV